MKFCFFGDVSNAIKGNTPGGGEQQTYMLAKALALDGHDVVIVDPYAKEELTTAEGIKLINVPNWDSGIKGLRMFTNRMPALYKIFVEQKADYYYVMMRSYIHLVPYLAAKKAGGKFVLAIASDVDVLDAKTKFRYEYKGNFKLSRFLTHNIPSDLAFNFLMQKADKVTLQHTGQQYKSTAPKNNQVLFSNLIELDKLPSAGKGEDGGHARRRPPLRLAGRRRRRPARSGQEPDSRRMVGAFTAVEPGAGRLRDHLPDSLLQPGAGTAQRDQSQHRQS